MAGNTLESSTIISWYMIFSSYLVSIFSPAHSSSPPPTVPGRRGRLPLLKHAPYKCQLVKMKSNIINIAWLYLVSFWFCCYQIWYCIFSAWWWKAHFIIISTEVVIFIDISTTESLRDTWKNQCLSMGVITGNRESERRGQSNNNTHLGKTCFRFLFWIPVGSNLFPPRYCNTVFL